MVAKSDLTNKLRAAIDDLELFLRAQDRTRGEIECEDENGETAKFSGLVDVVLTEEGERELHRKACVVATLLTKAGIPLPIVCEPRKYREFATRLQIPLHYGFGKKTPKKRSGQVENLYRNEKGVVLDPRFWAEWEGLKAAAELMDAKPDKGGKKRRRKATIGESVIQHIQTCNPEMADKSISEIAREYGHTAKTNLTRNKPFMAGLEKLRRERTLDPTLSDDSRARQNEFID